MPEQVQNHAEAPKATTAHHQESILYFNPKLINWSALLFAVLQSVCSAFIALNGVRLLIGLGAFAAASGALKLADRMHTPALRIPMMLLSLGGSILNFVVICKACRFRMLT